MIETFKTMAKGVGGSYTRWQGKPPAHGVFWIETDEGQTTVTAYDLRSRFGNANVQVSDGAMGPGNRPFASAVDFSDLSEDLQAEIRDRIVEEFENDSFFSD